MMLGICGPRRPRNSAGKCCGNFLKACTHSKENLLLSPDFIDILSAFSEEKVEFMVVGGYAIAFYGYVRGTGDIYRLVGE
jgi:hypothetical protein